MELKIRKNNDIYIVDISGEMDLYNSHKLKDLILKMIEKNVTKIIINLDELSYIDSSGIGALIFICSTVNKKNINVFITNVRGSVKKVVELTKLTDFFPIEKTVEDALQVIQAG